MTTPIRQILAATAVAVVAVAVGSPRTAAPTATASGAHGASAQGAAGRVQALGSVNLAALAALAPSSTAPAVRYTIHREAEKSSPVDAVLHPRLVLGGSTARSATVTTGGGGGAGLNGINILEMEKAGTGSYAGTNGGLEPPDQALCVGNGYVLEGVNQAWKVFTSNGAAITPSVPITQFFKIPPGGQPTPSSFVSDPRCEYDPQTGRFFALTLEADEASGVTQIPFIRSHTYFAVSKTGDPSGDWSIYNIDITDDGLMGTPAHATCPCIDDQPLMGLDQNGLYLSANEYSDSEIFPVAPPGQVYTVIGALPDFRNGQAQVYALSKAALVSGTLPAVQAFDTLNIPVPAADQNKTPISAWSSLQPAASPPGDHSPVPAGGAEFLLSQLDFQGTGDNRIGVWALTNTASLATATPALQLKVTVITTANPTTETYASPAYGVDQKDGPHPLGDQCGCPEEQLAANDDRMNEVMLTNGTLWAGVNTALPATTPGGAGPAGDPRAGVMYFQVRPGLDAGGNVTATMVRDGYVKVDGDNVLFPSIAASPAGPVAMFFTVTGVDYFPSAAWARLDGLAAGAAPDIHISAAGAAPEDGFTGYPTTNQAGAPFDPSSGAGVSRWGDYSYAAVDENGCLWGADDYIPDEARDPAAGNWGTYITRVQPEGCSEPAFATVTASGPTLHINPCGPLFTGVAGNDVLTPPFAGPVAATKGQNPQLNILSGDMHVSADGSTLSTILTINDLTTPPATGGNGNLYYVYWQYAGVQYYTQASVNGTTVGYADGTVDSTGLRTARSGGAADTGTLVLGKNGTVTVNVPTGVVGNPHKGNLIQGPRAETREDEGAIVAQYDAAGPTFDYLVGAACPASQSPAHTTGPAPAAAVQPVSVVTIPNTSGAVSGAAGALLASLTAAGLIVAPARRRSRGRGAAGRPTRGR